VSPSADSRQTGRPAAVWDRSVLYHGISAGALGGCIVAVFFFLFDLAAGRPFYTPTFLGSRLLLAAPPGSRPDVGAALVFGYTVTHAVVFIAIGAMASFIAADRNATRSARAVFIATAALFAVMEAVFLSFGFLFDRSLLEELCFGRVALGNLLAAAAMAPIVLGAHSDPESK
jgi:hypothetical protein